MIALTLQKRGRPSVIGVPHVCKLRISPHGGRQEHALTVGKRQSAAKVRSRSPPVSGRYAMQVVVYTEYLVWNLVLPQSLSRGFRCLCKTFQERMV